MKKYCKQLLIRLHLLLLTLTGFILGFYTFPKFGIAQTIPSPIPARSFGELVARIAQKILPVAFSLIVIMIIYAGFLFVMAGGDEQKITTAKRTLFWAVVGAIVLVGAYAVATAFINTVQGL